MINKLNYLVILFTSLALSFPVYSQICEPAVTTETLSEENFIIDDANGTVEDIISQLRWARCAFGQTWNGKTCEGFPQQLNWQEALTTADELDYGLINAWRIPDIKELMSIIDFQCAIPPLNASLFPQAPASLDNGLWSSTPVQTDPIDPLNPEVKIWFIDLGEGKVKKRAWNQTNYVFFVTKGKIDYIP